MMYFLDESMVILKMTTSAIKHVFPLVLTTFEQAFCNEIVIFTVNYICFQFKRIQFDDFLTVRTFNSDTFKFI